MPVKEIGLISNLNFTQRDSGFLESLGVECFHERAILVIYGCQTRAFIESGNVLSDRKRATV